MSNRFQFVLFVLLITLLFGFISFFFGFASSRIMCECFPSLYGFQISIVLGLLFIISLSSIKRHEIYRGPVKNIFLRLFRSLFFSVFSFIVLFVLIMILGEMIGGPYGVQF